MNTNKLRELLGYKLVFGLSGTAPTDAEVSLFAHAHARGLILYRRNCVSAEQIRQLVSGMEERLGYRLLVCIDHEGGRVVMPPEGVTAFPDNYAWTQAGATPAMVEEQGRLEAEELRALGIDLNFSPVADVATDTYNPGILSRSYGTEAKLCAEMVSARIRGLQGGGISATAKHYPGKGHATVDAHLKLPVINSTLEEMESKHLLPFFAAITADADCIMSSHPLYRNIDDSGPATFSKKLISVLLREKYGFKGVIVSDALEMGAITEVAPVEDAIIKAEEAGHDLLLVCTPGPAQQKACDALFEHYESGKGDMARLEKSVARIRKLHEKRPQRFGPQHSDAKAASVLAEQVAKRSAKILQTGRLTLPITKEQLQSADSLVIVPRYKDISSTVMIEPGMEDMEIFVRQVLGLEKRRPDFLHLPMNPTQEDLKDLEKRLSGKQLVLLLLWDAGLSSGWQKVLELTQKLATKPAVILMRDFYDARYLRPHTCAITGYGFRKYQTAAALRLLVQKS